MRKHITQVTLLIAIAIAHASAFARDIGEEQIGLLTYLHLKPGTEAAFKKELAKIVAPSRAESGNIAWYVQQAEEDPSRIVFYTRWVDQASLDWHLQSPIIVEYIQKTAGFLAEPVQLVRFKPLDVMPKPADDDDNCSLCP